MVATPIGSIAGQFAPGFDKAVSAGFEFTVHTGAAGLAKFEDFLNEKLEQHLSSEEYRLYTNPNDQYASAFVQGLTAFAESHPLIVAQDTYEWISSSSQLDSQLRTLIIKPALQESNTLAFVLAGRGDLSNEYRRSFEAEPHLLYVAPIKPFNADETRTLLEKYELQPDLTKKIQEETLGVPLAVAFWATNLKQTNQLPELGTTVAESDVVRQTTMRFLRYIVETPQDSPETARQKISDRHQIYTLALLRKYDAGALRVCWGILENGHPLSSQKVLERLQALRQRNEFLFEHGEQRMQSLVHDYIREYLRQQIRPDTGFLEREIVRKLNQAALDYYEQELANRERSLPTLTERAEDAEWRSLCLSTLNHKFWLDERTALQDLCRHTLESATFQSNWLPELVQAAREAEPTDQNLIKVLDEGVQSLFAATPDLSTVQRMWDEIGQRVEKWKLPPLYRALLADRRGRVLAAADRPLEAAQEIEIGLGVLPPGIEPTLREGLVDSLAGIAAILIIEVQDYQQAIVVAQRALQYDSYHVRAHYMLAMGIMGLKDYEKAQALLDKLIDEHPDKLEFRWGRLFLYSLQGRNAEVKEDLRQIAKVRPEFAQDIVRMVVEMGKDPNLKNATMKWGQDAGWKAKDIDAFSKLQNALSPEVLGELTGAILELMAVEKPTPEQILQLNERVAHFLPDWPEVQIDLGIAYLRAGRLDDALTTFARAQTLAPSNPATVTLPGLALAAYGHFAEALPFLEEGTQMLPGNSGPELLIISCLLNLGRIDDARTRAEAALKTYPEAAMLHWMYGQILIKSNNVEKGWQVQREAYQADPSILEQLKMDLLLGVTLGSERLIEVTKTEFPGDLGEILTSLPSTDMVRLYLEIIRASFESEAFGKVKPEVLLPVFEELIAHKPESTEIRLVLAELYDQTGQQARAISLLAEIVEQTPLPTQGQIHWALARLYIHASESEPAIHHLQKFLETSPMPEAYNLLADLHEAAGEIETAVNAYDQALGLADEQDVARLRKFGLYNLSVDRFQRAEELLRLLIAKQPDQVYAHSYLAEALYRQKRYQEARTSAEQALALNPEAPDPAARLVRICQTMGLADEAVSYQQKALQSLASVTNYDQACVLAILGQQEEALARLEVVLKETPEQRSWVAHDLDWYELRTNAAFKQMIQG